MKYNLRFVFVFITQLAFAQSNTFDSVITALQKDQLLFEKVYVHTNKTSYSAEDVIWFKAYVSDAYNKPSAQTSVLYVSLFTDNGVLIDTKNVLITNGVGVGQFQFYQDLPEGFYFIQANTNYMKNFGETNTFVSKVFIKGNIPKPKTNTLKHTVYDVQVFPEGGYLLEDVNNTLGLKALVNGKSSTFSGRILDSNKKEITTFNEDHLGMGRVRFNYKPSESYVAEFFIKDTIIKVMIPEANKKGVSIMVNTSNKHIVSVKLQSNRATVKTNHPKYTLLFHQKNKIFDFVQLTIQDSLPVVLELNKKSLFNGVNTVTVFENNNPILERQFFIDKPEKYSAIEIKKLNVLQDSIIYQLKLNDLNVKSNLSISVLKADTDYKPYTTIQSAYLLSPYVKGYVENPATYFNQNTKDNTRKVDLLLLTQGWSQYTTKAFVDYNNPKYSYDFESGFSLTGTVSPLKSNNLVLLSDDNQIVAKTYLNNKLNFQFKNLIAYKGDSIKIGFIRNGQQLVKPLNMYFDSIPKLTNSLNSFYYNKNNGALLMVDDFYKIKHENNVLDYVYTNSTYLDTIKLKSSKAHKMRLDSRAFMKKYREYEDSIMFYDPMEIPEQYYNKNLTLFEYLKAAEGASLVSWRGVETYLVARGLEAFLKVDGKGMDTYSLPSALQMRMEDISDIAFRRESKITIFHVFTTANYKNNITELFRKHFFESGFDKAKTYYTPKYINTSDNLEQEVDWKPIVVTDSKGQSVFKIINGPETNYLLSIQGFSDNGDLISEIKFLNDILVE
ncbi:hypothetical protein [Olleya sp. UBA1516]|uniref:hypothetical protein n=1 Tax=Olleya sp. UBA1516 TaxID=1947013 RepID=UPI0025CE712C|nr:hypothetical protein [Olleya sp. UBA1516]|tara:strand:+ start:3825 stop:6170 length:2346 start_codon:yes stop_codon:yes gene_type:complete